MRRTLERPGLGVRGCLGVRTKDQRGKGLGGYIREKQSGRELGWPAEMPVWGDCMKLSWKGQVWGAVWEVGVEGGGGG